ncbi:MAG: glycogen/starch/alpha-glucan phosphorylase [Epulopiscium sp.]|nr:glycogen/starch/alpha-glucan phosphorylase [Candidatus Epulonipiscium sp.]
MTTLNKEQLIQELQKELYKFFGKGLEEAHTRELYVALGNVLKNKIGESWHNRNNLYKKNNVKEVYYISMEFLTGTFTKKNLQYLDYYDVVKEALEERNISLEEILKEEEDPGLGNGGLGRLAAAFLDSLASLRMPGHGHGLRYKKGLFKQKIENGRQVEEPDHWLYKTNIWEYKRENEGYEIKFGGYISTSGSGENLIFSHHNYERVKAVPYDIPILGYKNDSVNYLRLWSGQSYTDVDFSAFARGDIDVAFKDMNQVRALTEFLYPEDSNIEGKRLRLKQEYFLISASIQDIVSQYKRQGLPLKDFYQYRAIHINDTHPVLAIPELMRILMDENKMEWLEAWDITVKTFGFTNHTIMSEAMERWDIHVFQELLPRIWMIVEEINHRFIHYVKHEKQINGQEQLNRLSIIENSQVKMLNLAIVGSHSVNGVAQLHTNILKEKELNHFYKIFPEKFNNKTNGIVHRRWLLNANPKLTALIKELIGDEFISNPLKLNQLLQFSNDCNVKNELANIKHYNKKRLAAYIWETQNIKINPYSIFDIHIKRIHEYKRQLLNILHVMYLYDLLKENPNLDIVPRTFIFGGKAATGYYLAKEVIKLIHSIAHRVNNDIFIKDKLKVVFFENYNVSAAELLIPAADVSEQISTTTKEASGTGNMKFMMNGAITIATLDGANVEIAKAVGEENIIIFGLRDYEVYEYYEKNNYSPKDIYDRDHIVKKTIDQLLDRSLHANHEEYRALYDQLVRYGDNYFILKDFNEYRLAHERINNLYRDWEKWFEISLINIAHSGIFSSDYTIKRYAKEIWDIRTI